MSLLTFFAVHFVKFVTGKKIQKCVEFRIERFMELSGIGVSFGGLEKCLVIIIYTYI